MKKKSKRSSKAKGKTQKKKIAGKTTGDEAEQDLRDLVPIARRSIRRQKSTSRNKEDRQLNARQAIAGQSNGVPDSNLEEDHIDQETGIRTLAKERILPYLATILLIAAGALVFIVYRSYAWPLFFALLLYVGFQRVNNHLENVFSGNRGLAAISTVVLVLILFVVPASLLTATLIEEVMDLYVTIDSSLKSQQLLLTLQKERYLGFIADQITQHPFFWVDVHLALKDITAEYANYFDSEQIGSWMGSIVSFARKSVTFTLDFVFNLLLTLVLLFFLFKDGPDFYIFLRNALPFPSQITDRFVHRMRELISTVLMGNVFIAILQGFAVGAGLYLAGIRNSLVYAFIASIFSLIPVIGTSVVWIPAATYLALVQESYISAIVLSIYCLTMYLLLENIAKPKVMDRKLGMHPLLLFLAILGGLAEFGFTGVILGPLFVTLFMTMWSIYHIWDARPSIPDDRKLME